MKTLQIRDQITGRFRVVIHTFQWISTTWQVISPAMMEIDFAAIRDIFHNLIGGLLHF